VVDFEKLVKYYAWLLCQKSAINVLVEFVDELSTKEERGVMGE